MQSFLEWLHFFMEQPRMLNFVILHVSNDY